MIQEYLASVPAPGKMTLFSGTTQPQSLANYSPETQAELARAERRRQIATSLMQQGLQGGPIGTQAGRFFVPRGWAQGLGDLAKVIGGVVGNYYADEAGRRAVEKESKDYQDIIGALSQQLAGQPTVSQPPKKTKASNIGFEDEDLQNLGEIPPNENNVTDTPATPAQPLSNQEKLQIVMEAYKKAKRIPTRCANWIVCNPITWGRWIGRIGSNRRRVRWKPSKPSKPRSMC